MPQTYLQFLSMQSRLAWPDSTEVLIERYSNTFLAIWPQVHNIELARYLCRLSRSEFAIAMRELVEHFCYTNN